MLLLALAVSIGLLVLLFRNVDPKQVLAEARKVDLRVFALAYVFRALGFLALIWRTRAIAKPLHTYRWVEATRAVFAGYFGNAVLPVRIGELMKVGYLSRVGPPAPTACLAFVAVERMLDLLAISFVGLWVFFIALEGSVADGLILLSVGSSLGVLFLVVVARSTDRIVELARSILGARANRLFTPRIEKFLQGLSSLDTLQRILPVLLATLLYWAASAASIAVWPLAFGLTLPWYTPLVVLVFLALGTAIPSTAAFVGTYHYAAAAALSLMGVPRETAVAMAIFVHAATFIPWTIVSGVILLLPLLKGQLKTRQVVVRSSQVPE
jgi:uncharacterized protein (TIRG00374 family)